MEMSPTERRKGGQSSHDGQNFLPELESVELSERGVSVAKQIDLSKWNEGEKELPSHGGTRTESELCQLGQSGC